MVFNVFQYEGTPIYPEVKPYVPGGPKYAPAYKA
jgi:hypothetical protein